MQLVTNKSWGSYISIRQSRTEGKNCYEGQRKTLYIDKSVKASKRYNNFKYKCIQQQRPKNIESETDKNEGRKRSKIILGYMNTPFSVMNRTTKQKINEKIEDLNNTMNQLIPSNIYRTPHPTTAEKAFFSSVRGTYYGIDHIQNKH